MTSSLNGTLPIFVQFTQIEIMTSLCEKPINFALTYRQQMIGQDYRVNSQPQVAMSQFLFAKCVSSVTSHTQMAARFWR